MNEQFNALPPHSVFEYNAKTYYKLPQQTSLQDLIVAICLNDGTDKEYFYFGEEIHLIPQALRRLLWSCATEKVVKTYLDCVLAGNFFVYQDKLYFKLTPGFTINGCCYLALNMMDGRLCFEGLDLEGCSAKNLLVYSPKTDVSMFE